MGYVDISTRISIRWLPDPASEPSDVLVYNVGSYYLDLRILKESGEIEWAFAGERQVISTEPCVFSLPSLLPPHPLLHSDA